MKDRLIVDYSLLQFIPKLRIRLRFLVSVHIANVSLISFGVCVHIHNIEGL